MPPELDTDSTLAAQGVRLPPPLCVPRPGSPPPPKRWESCSTLPKEGESCGPLLLLLCKSFQATIKGPLAPPPRPSLDTEYPGFAGLVMS
jgi:hypothetical protein